MSSQGQSGDFAKIDCYLRSFLRGLLRQNSLFYRFLTTLSLLGAVGGQLDVKFYELVELLQLDIGHLLMLI